MANLKFGTKIVQRIAAISAKMHRKHEMPLSGESAVFSETDWEDLHYLAIALEEGSFHKAAEKIGVEHTTVSRRIRRIEANFKISLFNRDNNGRNGLKLTPEGLSVLDDVKIAHSAVLKLDRKLRTVSKSMDTEIRMHASDGLANYWLIPRLNEFLDQNPNLRFRWLLNNGDERSLETASDITVQWTDPVMPDAVSLKLGMCRHYLYASPQYIERYGAPTKPEDLRNHRLFQFESYAGDPYLRRWNELVERYGAKVTVSNGAMTEALFRSGDYLALFPRYAVHVGLDLVRVPLDLEIECPIYVCYHSAARGSVIVRALVDEIKRLYALDEATWFQ